MEGRDLREAGQAETPGGMAAPLAAGVAGEDAWDSTACPPMQVGLEKVECRGLIALGRRGRVRLLTLFSRGDYKYL